METNFSAELQAELASLNFEDRGRVLEFARALKNQDKRALPPGTPGADLLKFVGSIPPEDLREISEAIEEGCGKVEPDEW